MEKPSVITQWLQQPANFSDDDRKAAAEIIKRYPYFVPARLMEASEEQKKQAYSQGMLSTMQLYSGNWLLFNGFLTSVKGNSNPATADIGSSSTPEEPLIAEDDVVEEELDTTGYEQDLDMDLDLMLDLPVDEDHLKLDVKQNEEVDDEPFATMGDPKEEPEVHVPEEKPEVAEPEETPNLLPDLPDQTPEEPEKNPTPIPSSSANQRTVGREDDLIQPIFTEDYFLHQGIQISDKIGAEHPPKPTTEDKSLMVVMSFAEWLNHFKLKNERDRAEKEDQKALKTMWQKEKLAAAMEEENDEIPEGVFEMAVNSITQEEGLASESLAEIYVQQGKVDRAIEMYRKLGLRNPQKNSYFAALIEKIIKDK